MFLESIRTLDNQVFSVISSIRTPLLTNFLTNLTNIMPYILIISFILLLFFLKKDKHHLRINLLLSYIFGYSLVLIIKFLIKAERPLNSLIPENGYSFPSGHALLATVLFLTLIFAYKNDIKNESLRYTFIALNIFLILFVSFSRIYLQVHYFSDVLAGIILGVIFFFTSKKIISRKYKLS